VYEDQVYGVVKHRMVILSMIYKIICKPWGLFIFVVLPILYIVGSEIIIAMLEAEERKRNRD